MAIGYRLVPGRVLLLLVLLVVGTTNVVIAQQNQSGPLVATIVPADETPEFKIVKRVDEVNLRFTVTDSHGHFQNQLSSSDFSLLDNHQPPAAIHFFQQQSTLPMRVGILIDVSASVAAKFKVEQKAASIFLQKVLRPGYDEAFVVTFDKNVRLLEDWFSDPKTAFSKLYTLHAGGDTALYDAVSEGLHHLQYGHLEKKALIIISDGGDNASHLKYSQVLAQARQSRALIYSIGLLSSDGDEENPGLLQRLCKNTGGIAYFPRQGESVATVSAEIARDLREQYTLGYIPQNLKNAAVFRKIEVKVSATIHGKLRVRARQGYSPAAETQPTEQLGPETR